jgi:DNA-binding IclR family transcriptional regulator
MNDKMGDGRGEHASAGPAPGGGGRTRAVDRALQLLCAIGATERPLTLSALARMTSLSPTTVLRLLRTMEHQGFVRRDGAGAWRPGLALVQLAASTLRTEPVYDLAKPHIVALAEETGESANLGIRVGERAVYLRHLPGRQFVRAASWTGRAIPLDGTAIGAALRDDVGGDGYASTRRTLEPDVTAIAAPITTRDGVRAALSIVAPTYRTTDADIAAYGRSLVRHAREIAVTLDATAAEASA